MMDVITKKGESVACLGQKAVTPKEEDMGTLFLSARSGLGIFLSLVVFASVGFGQTTTNSVTNGGTINVGATEIITNTVASPITAAITNNGSLQFWQTAALTASGAISGSGTVTKATGSGNLTLSGANTFSGKVTVSSGTLTASGVSDSAGSGLGQGTQIELGSGATLGVTVSSGTNSTTRQLIVNGNFTLANGGNGALVWNGNLVNNSPGNNTFFFNSTGTGTNEFAGVIGNGTSGALNLNFQATQIWKLSGSNTFTGGITIGGGKVLATTIADTGTASSVGAGGTIRFGYFNNGPSTFEYVGSGNTNNRQIKLGASAGSNNNTATFLQNGTGALVFTNTTFTVAGDVATTNVNRLLVLGGTNTLDNEIRGLVRDNDGTGGASGFVNSTITVVKDGVGKWILSGNNTYTGGTVISNGILQIGNGGTTGSVLGAITNNGTLILSRSGNPTISNAISGSGVLNVSSNSALTLSGASTFGGKVTVAGSSTLYAMGVADSGTSALGTNSQVELGSDPNNSSAALYVNVAAGITNTTARELIANGKSFTLGNFSNGVLVWNGNTTFHRGTNSSFAFNFGAAGTGTNVFAGIIGDTTPNIEFETTAPVNVTLTAASIWSLTGNNTFSGGLTINGGKVIADKLADRGTDSSIGTLATVRFGYFDNGPSAFEYVGSGSTNNMQVRLGASAGTSNNAASFLQNGTGPLVLTNASFTLAGQGGDPVANRLLILGGTNTADNDIAGIIANSGVNATLAIVKDGTGKWILSGNNTYMGGTTISNGILQIGNGGSTGTLGGGLITNHGTLIFNRTGTLTVSNAISGTGSVTKVGSGNLTFSGASSFSGDILVSGGTLSVSSVADSGSSSLGTGTQVTLGGSSTLEFTGSSSNSTTRALVLGGTGDNALRNMGSGALVWNGNVVNNMTANGAVFSLKGTGAGVAEFAGLITNNGANTLRLMKTEAGTWKVSGANTFTGLMDIFNGTLQATTIANSGTASSIGAGTTIRFGGFAGETGVLEYVGTGSTNNKQFKLGGGGTANTGGTILNNGSGALVFNNAAFNAAGDGLPASSARALTLGGTNAGDNAITGVIGNNNSSNTVSIVKADPGKWILSGNNTYTGDTTVSAGTLVVVRTNLTATITSNSISMTFSNTNNGTFPVLYGGPLSGSGYSGVVASTSGLGTDQQATFDAAAGTVTVASISTPPTITSTNAFAGTVGVAFSNNLSATGSAPVTFSGTSLPPGLSVATNGVITGTPSTAGNFNATLTAANAAGTNNQSVTFTIAGATPSDSSFTGWRGSSPATADLLQQYAYGAATAADQASRSNLPAVSLTNGNLVLTYFVRREATNTDLVVPQLSTNLGSSTNWGALPASNIATVGTNNVNGVDVVKKTATVPVDAASRKFLRLKIQE
jgi:autotransporter-associated beta strand protein